MFKVAVTQPLIPEAMAYLQEKAEVKVLNTGDPEEIAKGLDDVDGIIVRIGKMPRSVIKNAKNLKVIGRTGVGYDDVDVDAAAEMGIPVVYTPGSNSKSVAEYTIASMFAAAKNIIPCDIEMKKGNYAYRYQHKSTELFGKNIFIIGYGAIGREVAQICKSLGMKVFVFDKYVAAQDVEKNGYTYCDNISDGIPQADYITIHIPLTKETKGLISKGEFDLMKSNVVLVNHARGGIVDEEELVLRLNNHSIGAAALDVFVNEPPHEDDPILKAENIILSPHIAGLSKEALLNTQISCVDGVVDILNGNRWKNVARPKAYDHPKWQNK